MDIYGYAKSINYSADYMDMHTGLIYHIQEYGKELERGNMGAKIKVSQDGKLIGFARQNPN